MVIGSTTTEPMVGCQRVINLTTQGMFILVVIPDRNTIPKLATQTPTPTQTKTPVWYGNL